MFVLPRVSTYTPLSHTRPAPPRFDMSRLCVFASVALVVIFLVASWRTNQDSMAQIRVTPTVGEWAAYVNCVDDPACNLCVQPPVTFMEPPRKSVALYAPRGTGGTWVRLIVQNSVRVYTTIDDCFVPYAWTRFPAECAGPFFYKHVALTRFFLHAETMDHARYAPDAVVGLSRNPLDALTAAYNFYKTCGGLSSAICVGKSAHEDAFASPDFESFANRYADMFLDEVYAFDALRVPKIRLFYEDFRFNQTDTSKRLLGFMYDHLQNWIAPPARTSECAEAYDDDTFSLRGKLPFKVYSPQLLSKLCEKFRPIWNAEKWGESCEASGN